MEFIGVVGLGYVGLSLAHFLAEHGQVVGFDISSQRINELKDCHDSNQILSAQELRHTQLKVSNHLEDIKSADFYIVAVPTPAFYYELPNLTTLEDSTKMVASVLKKGDIVVFESTVYPGTTEEVCIPILEEVSQLTSGTDFFVGYSPERINPGDEVHTLRNTPKIISCQSDDALQKIQAVYECVCDEVVPVSSIKVAEAVKILENTQRDINIAFMNEFCKIMHALNISTQEVIEGAKTKWSFMPYKPGFVGGHCIAIDPYYLAFKAKRHAVDPKLILAARQTNNDMTQFIIHQLNESLVREKIYSESLKIGVFGITYKENIPDIRSSLAIKLVKELREEGFAPVVHDPLADNALMNEHYCIDLAEFDQIHELDVAIIVVQHDFYRQQGAQTFYEKLNQRAIMMDIPNMFVGIAENQPGLTYWHL